MTAALSIAPLEFPPEFEKVLPDAELHGLEELIVVPGTRRPIGICCNWPKRRFTLT